MQQFKSERTALGLAEKMRKVAKTSLEGRFSGEDKTCMFQPGVLPELKIVNDFSAMRVIFIQELRCMDLESSDLRELQCQVVSLQPLRFPATRNIREISSNL